MKLRRVLMMSKSSAYELYAQDPRDGHFTALARAGNKKVRALRVSHDEHYLTVEAVEKALDRLGVSFDHIPRDESFDERLYDLVIAVGGDGTFIAASHFIRSVPLMGVNSAPRDSVGFYCCATRKTIDRILGRFQRGTLPRISLQRLAIEIDGKRIKEQAINDVLYSHENLAAMARYALKIPGGREEQKSSGIWIAVPAGSGGAIGSAGGRRLALESRKFQFVVREPYHPHGRQYRLRKGVLGPEDVLEIENHVVYGVIFIDGSHISHKIPFDSRVRMRLSEYPLEVFGLRVPKRVPRLRR